MAGYVRAGRGGPGEDFAEWGGVQTYEKRMPRGLRRLAMSGGVGGIPARILLSGGAFKATKNLCPEASGGWLCQGESGGSWRGFC